MLFRSVHHQSLTCHICAGGRRLHRTLNMNNNTALHKVLHDAFWMPYTPNRQFKAGPRLVASAKGVAYRTPDGREVLDGTSGLWCVGAGHCHQRIAQAMKRQIDTLDFASSFQVGHAGAFELAERIGALAHPAWTACFWSTAGLRASTPR